MVEPPLRTAVAESELFRGLAPAFIDFLSAHARARQLGKDEVLFRFGEKATHFYLIASGRITIEVAAIEGPTLELQELGAGATVGWSWLIPPHRWSFQARAVLPTELIEFDGAAVLARCEADSAFGYALLKRFSTLMSERLQSARQRMMEEWSPAGFA
jgi:CRP/FNR family transcriptional regulator, cyclic AMP receptor protein